MAEGEAADHGWQLGVEENEQTGIGLGRSPSGVIPLLRKEWQPVARKTPLLAGLLVVVAALWALRLLGVVNGRVLLWGVPDRDERVLAAYLGGAA